MIHYHYYKWYWENGTHDNEEKLKINQNHFKNSLNPHKLKVFYWETIP